MPASTRPAYRWDNAAGRYRSARGTFLSPKTIRKALDSAIERGDLTARALAVQLQNREVTLREWEAGMRGLVKSSHLAAAAAAKGGWAQMNPASYGVIGRRLRDQYGYLSKFASELAAGLPLDGRMVSRAELYIEAARAAYHTIERREMAARGMSRERNVLAPADHCDGCLQADAIGWVPLGTLPPIGSRDCRTRCKCTIEYEAP